MVNQKVSDKNTALIQNCQQGDKDAFRVLYDAFNEKVYSNVFYMTGNEEAAKEITQLVFIKIYRYIDSFEFRSSIDTWIYKLTTNTCLNYMKSAKQKKYTGLENVNERTVLSGDSDSEDLQSRIHTSEAIKRVINKLNPKYRTIVILKYINDLSYSEIAEVLGCSIGTVSSRLNRCHKKLYIELKFLVE